MAYLATGGRSRETVENVLLTLSSILRKAKAWDCACGSFSLADITLPREGVKKEQRCFTDEEVGKILAAAREPFGTILALTSVLGLRIGEVLALRVSDVDFSRKIDGPRKILDTKRIAARRAQGVGWKRIAPPKWESESELFIASPWRVPKLGKRILEPRQVCELADLFRRD